jgi:hypothetical protein
MGFSWIRTARRCALVAAMLLFSSIGHAAIVWDWNNTDPNFTPPTIADVYREGGLLVGDKLFTFPVDGVVSSGSAFIQPSAADIRLSAFKSDNGDYGLKFKGLWFADAGETLDTTITYAVAVSPSTAGYLIKDNALTMPGSITKDGDSHARVEILEKIFSTSPEGPNPQLIASERVYDTVANSKIFDSENFMLNGSPVAVPKVWVVKDVSLIGGATGAGASLSYFTQTFSQVEVPEPQTLVMLLCGVPALALVFWRRCQAQR